MWQLGRIVSCEAVPRAVGTACWVEGSPIELPTTDIASGEKKPKAVYAVTNIAYLGRPVTVPVGMLELLGSEERFFRHTPIVELQDWGVLSTLSRGTEHKPQEQFERTLAAVMGGA